MKKIGERWNWRGEIYKVKFTGKIVKAKFEKGKSKNLQGEIDEVKFTGRNWKKSEIEM